MDTLEKLEAHERRSIRELGHALYNMNEKTARECIEHHNQGEARMSQFKKEIEALHETAKQASNVLFGEPDQHNMGSRINRKTGGTLFTHTVNNALGELWGAYRIALLNHDECEFGIITEEEFEKALQACTERSANGKEAFIAAYKRQAFDLLQMEQEEAQGEVAAA